MALQKDFISERIVLTDGGEGEGGKKTPPTSFRIFKAGLFDTTKGPFVFDDQASADVLRNAADYGNEFCVDYNHGMADGWPVDPALAGRAAGWFKVELRNGELWAVDVRWTPAATAAISAGEWRYISPWFSMDPETRRIHTLHNVALTNTPATKNLTPLVASRHRDNPTESPNMNPKLLALLGLSATATEAEVQAALSTLSAKGAGADAQNIQVTELLSLTGKATLSEALGVAKGWKASADALPAVQAELANLKAVANDVKLTSLLDEAVKAGKLAPSARPAFETLGRKDLPQLEAMLSAMPVILPGAGDTGAKPPASAVDTAMLTAEDISVAKQMGIDPKDLAAHKAARQAKS